MKKFKTYAHIKHLNGELREIIIISPLCILGNKIPHTYICRYNNIRYCVIHNQYNLKYYVDDIYGMID